MPPLAPATVTCLAAGAILNLKPGFGLRLDYGHERRKNFYSHNSFGGGVTLRF